MTKKKKVVCATLSVNQDDVIFPLKTQNQSFGFSVKKHIRWHRSPTFAKIYRMRCDSSKAHQVYYCYSFAQRCKAVLMFFAMLAAMCPLISSSLGIVVLRFDILDFDVNSPLTTPDESSITAMTTAEHAVLLESANTCR